MTYVLFNPLSGNPTSFEAAMNRIRAQFSNAKFYDVRDVKDWKAFLSVLRAEDEICICGGDGTLNRFINDTEGISFSNEVYYCATGTGNDFLKDLGEEGIAPVCITSYIRDLPIVTVKGKSYRFLNGVGFGIDGYCCQVGDEQKKRSVKSVNYTAIAIKGLLFHYHPTNARVTVDGKEYEYRKVWIAPTMHGRYYGGGMMPTPAQARTRTDGKNSLMLFHGSGKLHTLMVFPSLFKGEHLKHEKLVHVHEGEVIKVTFDRPVALQIDGETILDVTEYEVVSAAAYEKNTADAALPAKA